MQCECSVGTDLYLTPPSPNPLASINLELTRHTPDAFIAKQQQQQAYTADAINKRNFLIAFPVYMRIATNLEDSYYRTRRELIDNLKSCETELIRLNNIDFYPYTLVVQHTFFMHFRLRFAWLSIDENLLLSLARPCKKHVYRSVAWCTLCIFKHLQFIARLTATRVLLQSDSGYVWL